MGNRNKSPMFAVLTPQLEEYEAVKKVLSINSICKQKTNKLLGTYDSFKINLDQDRSTTLVLKCIDEMYNTPCAVVTERLFASIKPSYIFLLGSACGNPTKDNIFNVILGEKILFLGRGRRTDRTVNTRPHTAETDMKDQVTSFLMAQSERHRQWNSNCLWYLKKLHSDKLPQILQSRKNFAVKGGTIASADMVLSWKKMARAQSWWLKNCDEARAYDMESAGFSYTCRKNLAKWLVFRCVSDRGISGEEKDHFSAAAVAAFCLLRFVDFLVPGGVSPSTVPEDYNWERLFSLLSREERQNDFVGKGRFIKKILRGNHNDVLALAKAIVQGDIEEYQEHARGRSITAIRLDLK